MYEDFRVNSIELRLQRKIEVQSGMNTIAIPPIIQTTAQLEPRMVWIPRRSFYDTAPSTLTNALMRTGARELDCGKDNIIKFRGNVMMEVQYTGVGGVAGSMARRMPIMPVGQAGIQLNGGWLFVANPAAPSGYANVVAQEFLVTASADVTYYNIRV